MEGSGSCGSSCCAAFFDYKSNRFQKFFVLLLFLLFCHFVDELVESFQVVRGESVVVVRRVGVVSLIPGVVVVVSDIVGNRLNVQVYTGSGKQVECSSVYGVSVQVRFLCGCLLFSLTG